MPIEGASSNDGEAAIAYRIDGAQTANQNKVKDNSTADKSYQTEWRRFREFVDKERELKRIPDGNKYLNRQNVDLYFGEVVSKYKVVPDSARRVVSSLQWYSDHQEHPGDTFQVESTAVIAALKAQKVHRLSIDAMKIRDPHGKLPTDVMTEEEYDKAHGTILKRFEWLDLQLSWTTMDQTYARYGSWSKFELKDIVLDKAHGPPRDTGPGNKSMIALVLRPGGVHKDRFKHTRVVGSWRHLKPYRCSTGALAMNLMVRCRFDPKFLRINFYKNCNGSADWWSIPLRYKWGTKSSSAETAYRSVYQEANISWSKCLHLRKGGMDKAGTAGVGEEAVSTMSKHSTKKIRRYMPELHSEVMSVMAGFQTNEEYYVPRCLLVLPWSTNEITRAVFPQYDTWVQQYFSPQGDHSVAAKNFLEETLPFLAVVALQDGIYWIKDYPNNSAAIMLKNTFPNYESWALQARKEVVQQQADLEESRVSNMEASTQAAFHVIRRDMNSYHEEVREERKEAREMIKTMEQRAQNAEKERDNLLRQLYGQRIGGSTAIPPSGTLPAGMLPIAPHISPTHRRTIQVPTQGNALSNLRSSARLPEIPPKLPDTMFELLVQYQQAKLSSFELAAKKDWPQPMKLRFSKRMYLYNQIRKRAQRHQGNTEEDRMKSAAMAMDVEKTEKRSMNEYYKLLKSVDPNTKTRAKRKSDQL